MKPEEVKVEQGVAIPSHRTKGWIAVLRKLGVGESFWIAAGTVHKKSPMSYFGTTARRIGIKIATRQEGEGHRVWRTE